MLQAVLFDLDGTLLRLNAEEFVREYLKEISAAAASVVEPRQFVKALLASTEVMQQQHNQRQTNAEVFWADFHMRLGKCAEDLKPLLEDYYARQFNSLSRIARADDKALQAAQKALDLGLRIVLATNPMFPESAIRDRMDWAGVGELPWELVTSYENMHHCKPYPAYYLEIASLIKVEPQNCLMVGNDVQNDIIPAASARMHTFLVNNDSNSQESSNTRADGSGNLSAFIVWLNGLPRQ